MDKAQMRRGFNIVAALIVLALVVGLYKAKSDAAHTESRVRNLETQIADTQADMRVLRSDIARAESPANIEAMAERELGLVVGSQAATLPEAAIDQRLPAPRPQQGAGQ
jgi:hypothetical protein